MENEGLQKYLDHEVPKKIKKEKKQAKEAKKQWKENIEIQRDLHDELVKNKGILNELQSECNLKESQLDSEIHRVKELRQDLIEVER